MPTEADTTNSTEHTDSLPPVPIDLEIELAVMRGTYALIERLDYEGRVRVLAWLSRRFDVDTDALRF
jgi:hypothetical protein